MRYAIPAGVCSACLIALVILVIYGSQMTVLNPRGWITVDDIGSRETDFISRAVVAKIGLFANSKDKAIYLSAHPAKGIDYKKLFSGPKHWFALDSSKHYQITGNVNIPSAWWSITLYDDRDLLVKNPGKIYSYTSYNLKTDAKGNFTIDVASVKPPGAANWLPSPVNRPFNLKMRIYEPEKEVYENIRTFPLPEVKEVKI